MHQGNLPGYLLLELEVGSFFIPDSKSGRYVVHCLDTMQNPGQYSCREVRDEGGGICYFIVFCADYIQLECVDVFLELLSRVDAGGGQPVHGLSGGIGVDERGHEVGFELGKGPKGQHGQPLLASDFCPGGSRSLLHVGQGKHNLPVIIIV